MPICAVCDTTFRAKRLDAKTCSAKCRKASSRCPRTVQDSDVTDNPGESTSPADVTDNGPGIPPVSEPVLVVRAVADQRVDGQPFTFADDTIPGRRWRVVAGHLQCEALGGWKDVFEVGDSAALDRALAWLSGNRTSKAHLDERYGVDRIRNDRLAIRPPSPPWGKRSSPGCRRLPCGSRPTHENGLAYSDGRP
jgi:hypothetical protein